MLNKSIAILAAASVVAMAGLLNEPMPEHIPRQRLKVLPPPPNWKAERRKAMRVAAMKARKAKKRGKTKDSTND